jgi:elongation factor Ts
MITTEMVKTLRDKTGAKMMDCKQALTASAGQMEAATDWLRQKNLNTDVTEKPASEGRIGYRADSNAITIVEMSASTDFAANGQDFKDCLMLAVIEAHNAKIDSIEALNNRPAPLSYGLTTIGEQVLGLAGRLGENVAIKRVVRMEGNIGHYVHFDNKQAAAIEMDGVAGELAEKIGKDICMHIVFAKPGYLTRNEVPVHLVEAEKQIIQARLQDDPKNKNKPPQIVEKIVAGQLGKFYGQSVFVDQGYYKDGKKPMTEILKELGDIKVKRFVRFQVGVI